MHGFLFIFNIPTGSLYVVVCRLAALYDKLSFGNVFPEEFHSSVIIIHGVDIGLRTLKDFKGHVCGSGGMEMVEKELCLSTAYFLRIG